MKRYEALETLFGKTDLSFAQSLLNEPYHQVGSRGRPPRNPLGIFKAHIVKRVKHIPSDRMLVRQMWKDPRLKKICDIEANQQPYGIAVLSRFRTKVGPERLAKVIDQTIEVLVAKGRIKGEALALDITFIKACSRRNLDNRTGYSDPESGIGRAVKAKDWVTDFIWLLASARDWSVACYSFIRNQLKGARGILRVDRKFRNHGPTIFKVA